MSAIATLRAAADAIDAGTMPPAMRGSIDALAALVDAVEYHARVTAELSARPRGEPADRMVLKHARSTRVRMEEALARCKGIAVVREPKP